MTKKDIVIFLNIFLLGVKDLTNNVIVEFFRDDVYSILRRVDSYDLFMFEFDCLRLSNGKSIYKHFYHFLNKISKVLDK